MKDLYEKGFFPANTLTATDPETVQLFGDGEAAFLIDGSWKVSYFMENYPDTLSDYAISYVPAKGERTASQAIGGISIGYFITKKAWDDPKLRTALGNTVILTICTVVFQVGIALILALLADSIRVGAQLFRTLYFFPIVISATALGLMFNLIFLYPSGMLNQLLMNLGVISEGIDWKNQEHFMFTMLTPVMWQYVGFYFVILVTGLNNISPNLYEAAALDGCVGLNKVRYITLPLLRNVLCTCLVLAITGA